MFEPYLKVHVGAGSTSNQDEAKMLLPKPIGRRTSAASKSNDLLYGMVRHEIETEIRECACW
jgi:hypothetical protein